MRRLNDSRPEFARAYLLSSLLVFTLGMGQANAQVIGAPVSPTQQPGSTQSTPVIIPGPPPSQSPTPPSAPSPLPSTVPGVASPPSPTPAPPVTPGHIAPDEMPIQPTDTELGIPREQALPEVETEEAPAQPAGTELETPGMQNVAPQSDAQGDLLKKLPSDVTPSEKPLLQEPIRLFDREKLEKGAAMLENVLTASVVKVQEYPVSLPVVLKLVEVQNLPLQDFTLNAKIQNNQYYRSLAELLPNIQGTYDQSRFQGVVQVFGSQTIPVYQSRIVPQLTASWTIYPGGRDIFNALAARQRAKGAKFDLSSTLQEQLTQATVEYYELLAAGVNVANIRINIQEVKQQVALNEARLRAGVGTKLDLERARSQLVQREQQLITAENVLAQSQQNLLNRLNLDPTVGLVPPQVAVAPRVLVPLTIDTQQLVNKAIETNPRLKVMDTEIKALGLEGKAVLSSLIPSVTLTTYINGTGPQIDQLGLSRFGGLSIQSDIASRLGTAIPLDYRTRRLQVAQKKVQRQQLVREIQTEVIRNFLDSRAAAKSIFVAQEELEVAQEAYRLSFGRYKAGLNINVDVLNSQTSLAIARTNVVRAILDFNEAQVRLLRSLGEIDTDSILNGIKTDAFAQKPAP